MRPGGDPGSVVCGGGPGRGGTNEVDPIVRMKGLQLCGAAAKDELGFLFCGGVATLFSGLHLSPHISPVVCALHGVVRITRG